MKHETLSSKIESCMCSKENCEFKKCRVEHVREAIQKLKEKLCKEWIKNKGLNFSEYDRIPQDTILEQIDNIFGPALIHSPQKSDQKVASPEDTPEGQQTKELTSGTHGSGKIGCTKSTAPKQQNGSVNGSVGSDNQDCANSEEKNEK